MEASRRKPAKVYGKKKKVDNNAALFLNSSPDAERRAKDMKPATDKESAPEPKEEEPEQGIVDDPVRESKLTKAHVDVQIPRRPESKAAKKNVCKDAESARSALDDITAALTNIQLSPPRAAPVPMTLNTKTTPAPIAKKSTHTFFSPPPLQLKVEATPAPPPFSPPKTRQRNRHQTVPPPSARPTPAKAPDPRLQWLAPLTTAWASRGHAPPSILPWSSILHPSWTLRKLAESSFAEVYHVSNPLGTSVLKIMALRPPSGPGSRRETACKVEEVVSEVMIMDGLTELPGFVDFRGCWLVSGCPPVMLQQAWEVWDEGERDPDRMPEGGQAELDELGLGRSDFPHPSRYNKGQVFLVLELGDAGTDIEHYDFREGRECWDVLLGTISALALGEAEARFEHRDLHEGNVCVRRVREPSDVPNGDSKHRFGYSGLEVTLLDYTLSRATFPTDSGEETLFLDLETNPDLFAPDPLLQRQMYRRMKNHVLFNHYGVDHKLTEDEKTSRENGHKWQMSKPYTNVIWIHYVLEFLIQDFKGPKKELERFKLGVKELREMLSPDVPIEDGGFASAEEVRAFCVEEGLMDEGDGLSFEE